MSLLTTISEISSKGFTDEIKLKYSQEELYVVQKILEEFNEHGRSDTLESLWENDFERRPVSIDEFLEDDYYLGRIGRDVYPVWREDLRKVLNPLSNIGEWVIRGSIGSGKTMVAVLANVYRIYYLLCLHNPQKFYGLAEGSPIIFGLFNIFKYLAGATSYQYMITWLRDMSPFFAQQRGDHLRPDKRRTNREVLNLPKNIGIALGSTAINALGQNILGGLCDETEFGRKSSITSQEKSQVADLYHNVRTRIDSRFMQKGGINPGLLCLSMDTCVPTLDGTERLLDEFSPGEKYWLYSYKDGEIVPAEGIFLGVTRQNVITVRVTLDNYESIECTPDHKFMLRDGSYKEAGFLRSGDSLMPLYRNVSKEGYEFCMHLVKTQSTPGRNHKVVSVEEIGRQDVGCFHVPTENCFGLSAGVIISNCLVSSSRDYEQFMSHHVRQKKDDPHTYISNYALYDVKAHVYKDSPRFTVVVGDKLHRSYILDDQEDKSLRPGAKSIQVPVEFYGAFVYDIDTAIRDISGVETYGKTLFFPRRDLLLEGIEKSTPRSHPFHQDEITLSIDDDYFIEDYFKRDEIIDNWDRTNDLWRPKFHPYADRFVHVDLAKNRDAAGFCMGCIGEQIDIFRFNTEGQRVRARDYKFFVDIFLRIRATHGSEIDFAKIRQFIFFLNLTCNFRIKWVSYDSYQSTDSIQIFKKEKIQAKELSLDRKPGPYRAARSVLMECRADMYYYAPFFDEITLLEDHTGEKGKIDHPVGGSKDVSDAFAGVINGALISKGVSISGTDADQFKRRASAYEKAQKQNQTPDLRDKSWVGKPGNVINSLEAFFKEK